jgi:3-deoxy-D-manno-octulosonate 8-phosphate phosphatase (KDO 8-P phosphatase)
LNPERGTASIRKKASRIKLLLFDVDGVLTDGKILVHGDGSESKLFDIRDGTGIVWAQRIGLRVGILSARSSPATARRAAQLGIATVHQGGLNKLTAYAEILRQHEITDAQVAYMGDDLLDLPIVKRVGLSACPSDAVKDVRSRVDYVSRCAGGNGAARDFIELVLKAQRRWKTLVASYVDAPTPTVDTAADRRKKVRHLRLDPP